MNKKEKIMIILSVILICASIAMGIHSIFLQKEINHMTQYQEYLQDQIEKQQPWLAAVSLFRNFFKSFFILKMQPLICSLEDPISAANFFTSCATTANPFPASPDLAASIDALSDKIFCLRAYPLISFITSAM